MVDDAEHPPQPTEPGPVPAESVQTPAPDADAAKVVSLADAKKARGPAAAQGTPSSLAGATAPDAGAGGGNEAPPSGGKKKPERKAEKTIDWGVFNRLVESWALIYGTDTVWDGDQRMIMKLSNMGHAHGGDMVRMWKASPLRRTVLPTDVVFDPTGQADPERCINLFDGIKMVPKEGDVGPIMELIRHLMSRSSDDADECDEHVHWMLCWLAYPLQHLGAKLRTAIVMHGDEGAGKNFLFDLWVSMYGQYGISVGQDELEDKFNDWRSSKLAVVGDEVSTRQEMVHNKNRLKALITSETVQINPKNLPRRQEANHMNIVFLSNELAPLALDNSDRRYMVIYTPKAREFEFYRRLRRWRDNGGVEAFYAYLLAYPLDGFDPFAPAPITAAKRDLIDINRKSPELFWLAWSKGEIDLPYHPCSLSQAYRGYLKWCQRTGDRFPFKQNMFTRTLLRIAETCDMPLREKVMAPRNALGVKKSERMLLMVDPPEQDQGTWAGECRDSFETALRSYMGEGFPRPPGAGSTGEDE